MNIERGVEEAARVEKGSVRLATCFVEKRTKLVSLRTLKAGKRFTGLVSAREFASYAEIFRNFCLRTGYGLYKIFLHNWKLYHQLPVLLSLSLFLSVPELRKKRLPSRFARAKAPFPLIFFATLDFI